MAIQKPPRDWLSEFISELEALRPHLKGSKIARRVADEQWRTSRDIDGFAAARQYHKDRTAAGAPSARVVGTGHAPGRHDGATGGRSSDQHQ